MRLLLWKRTDRWVLQTGHGINKIVLYGQNPYLGSIRRSAMTNAVGVEEMIFDFQRSFTHQKLCLVSKGPLSGSKGIDI